MTAPRLRSLTVRGFRAYGAPEQTLNLPTEIAVVWAPNSKGKTSLAEAVEFLLTGQIARREMMASSQDEFADSLRNVHINPHEDVYVAAKLIASDGAPHDIRRVLIADYAKKQDCRSRLEIDGKPAHEHELASLGISLSHPPLSAPVLAQHTLSYLFSVRPQDRATYFKTLLEVADLDVVRSDLAGLAADLALPADPLLPKLEAACEVPILSPFVGTLRQHIPDESGVLALFDDGASALISASGESPPPSSAERFAAIERILAERRSKTFPIDCLRTPSLPGWTPTPPTVWAALGRYLSERAKIDEETRRLVALFDEALKAPSVASATSAVDCPVCETRQALTPARINAIRAHVENAGAFKAAESAARSALNLLATSAESAVSFTESAVPTFLRQAPGQRRATGFTIARLEALLDRSGPEFIPQWMSALRRLRASAVRSHQVAHSASTLAETQSQSLQSVDSAALSAAFDALPSALGYLRDAFASYELATAALVGALSKVIDAQSDTSGWQDFVDISKSPKALRQALIQRRAQASLVGELDTALREVDSAKEAVLDDKFADYSDLVQAWWERLRPGEPTFFSAVQPRKGAKRTIDFKAGLSPLPNRLSPKMRDVIAIFSQSQLHCLGLALFLARAQHENAGFIVLDDPVISSDDDYRAHFNSTVLEEILKLPMQVIVLTQAHGAWEDIEIRYRHLGVSTAQLYIDSVDAGTIIENTSDTLMAKINRAKSLAKGGHPDVRKECGIQLRDAGELFCKEILIKGRHLAGEKNAAFSDYDGKVLEWLCPHVEPLLGKDPSHPGKLAAFRKTVNSACHDNAPPGTAEMTQACGEIGYLAKEYLR